MIKRLRTIDWEDGAAEILSFCLLLPVIFFIILTFCNMSMMLQIKATVEYCLYTGGRTAAIAVNSTELDNEERLNIAMGAANEAVEKTMDTIGYAMVDKNADVAEKQWKGTIEVISDETNNNSSSGIPWAKGSLFVYKITAAAPNFVGKTPNVVESAIVMMVESPAIESKITNE